ncbi:MAG TPA: M17 family peptidase N-terminal domain-containing protein, partial [Gaiellaceae bacterium]
MEEVAIEVRLPGQIEPDTLAIPLPDNESAPLSDGARVIDERLGGRLRRLADDGELRGELGETVLLHTDGELNARRLVVAGIGKPGELDADTLRTAAAAVARQVADVGGTIAWLLDESLPLPFEEQARAVVEGILLGSYS